MLKLASLIIFVCLIIPVFSFAQQVYTYQTDLVNIKDDQVSVTLQTPAISSDTVIYSFPKAIPGSYAVKDFGRFIKDFKAFKKSHQSKSNPSKLYSFMNSTTLLINFDRRSLLATICEYFLKALKSFKSFV